jgi:hypothetical protein
MKINIANADKAQVLSALYNASKQQGMGFMHARGAFPMSVAEAQAELNAAAARAAEAGSFSRSPLYFDYLHGRVMKTDLSGDVFDTWGFDRDNGDGAAANALQNIQGVEVQNS